MRVLAAGLRRYWQKLSGPLLDRFDLLIEVPPVDLFSIAATARGEPSSAVRARVEFARAAQHDRFGSLGPTCNAAMGPADLERHAALGAKARELLVSASVRLGLSARGYDRIRRVARTLADLEGSASIEESHVAEAIQYRRGLDRRLP
jgi:magnesium chelatase family protein